jgi:uncharacterized protein (TIGR02646 family)
MKRTYKSPPPNALTVFAQLHAGSDWDNDFRNYARPPSPPNIAGHDYQDIKTQLITDQGGLCAYCEIQIVNLDKSQQRVEHFHPKSDSSNPDVNWALDWGNILVVCMGGENEDKERHPKPANLSCDAYKNHYINKQKLDLPNALLQLTGELISPLQAPAFPLCFDFNKANGQLFPHKLNCSQVDLARGLNQGETLQKLQKTIDILNLNCARLCGDRLEILKFYNQAVSKARAKNDRDFKQKITNQWFSKRWPSFFTTWRILLGSDAEVWLHNIQYNG